MAITVKHKFVSTIPDAADTSIVRPTNWNDTHDLTGFGTAAELNAGVANGVATLDGSGTVPISQLPAAVLGALSYQGTWDASTNTPTLTSSVGTKGYYYVVNVAGSTNLNGITDWKVGDWAVYNGTAWQKIDNTDAVTSVNGYTGTVVLTQPDIAGTVPTTRTITAGTGLTGGGDLSADRTLAIGNTGATAGTYGTDARTITQTVNAQGQITNIFDQPISIPVSQINNLGTGVGTFLTTPTSANLKAAVTDETGSGALVFGTQPTLSKPSIDGTDPYIQFFNGAAVTSAAGRMWYNSNDGTLNFGMGGGNITQQVGEELFVYGKATATISDSPLQIIYKTGTIGASGVITFAPTVSGLTDSSLFVGCATEPIASGSFGRVTCFGNIHGIDTTGSTYGETWAAGDTIWYNPTTGNPTKTKPSAPNIKISLGTVINVSATLGTFSVEIIHGSELGGTDSNVQITSVANGNLLTYDGADGYWRNTDLAAGTGISVSKSSTGVLTVTNTAPSSGGTVTSVTGTAPIASTGGTTPAISISQATTSTNGYLSSTDWNTFNNKQPAGSYLTAVTADAPLSGSGTSGSHLVIATANTTTIGALTSTDWNTFNGKQAALVSGTNIKTVSGTSLLGSGDVGTIGIAYGGTAATSYTAPSGNVKGLIFYDGTKLSTDATTVTDAGYDTTTNTLNSRNFVANNGMICNSMTVSSSYSIPSGFSAMAAGPITVASGQTVTIPSGSRWVVL